MDDGNAHDPAPGGARPAGSAAAALDPRTRILRATTELLAEVGWNHTTTRRVADRAGVNNALVHYYFGTKRALLLQAATDVLLSEFGGALDALAGGGTLSGGVNQAVTWLAQAGPSDRSARVVAEVMLQAVHDPALRESMRAMLREFRAGVAAKAAEQGMGEDAARGLATVLAAVLDGLYLHALLDDELDLSAASTALRALFPQEDA